MILYKRPAFVRLKRKENQYGVKFRKASLSQEGNLTSTIRVVHSLQKGHKAGPGWPTNSLQAISLHQAVLTLCQIGQLLQIEMCKQSQPWMAYKQF